MDLENTAMRMIIVVAIIFVLSTSYLQGIENARPPIIPKTILITNDPGPSAIKIEPPRESENGWEWPEISIELMGKYNTELDKDVEVQPIMFFNGKEKKTNPFTLGKDAEFQATPTAKNIVTQMGPITCQDLSVGQIDSKDSSKGAEVTADINMKPGSKLMLKPSDPSMPNFTLALTNLGMWKGESLSEKLKNTFKCGGTFEIECQERTYNFNLFDMEEACSEGNIAKCQQTAYMCNSTVTITGKRMNCENGFASVKVSIELHNYNMIFPVGERLKLAFFKNSECVKQLNSVHEMRIACQADYLGDTLYFTGKIVSTPEGYCP
jgi:hypothetical protein